MFFYLFFRGLFIFLEFIFNKPFSNVRVFKVHRAFYIVLKLTYYSDKGKISPSNMSPRIRLRTSKAINPDKTKHGRNKCYMCQLCRYA